MYRTILLPLDGSTVAERAVPYAEVLARAGGARLLLLRALAGAAPGSPHGQVHTAHAARAYLAGVAAHLDRRTVVETVVFPAPLAEAIRREMRLRNVDLLVMTVQGHAGPERDRSGRVAALLIRRAEVPVLLVPGTGACSWPRDRCPRLLLPLDGCACAAGARRYADDLATALGAELLVVRVAAPSPDVNASTSPPFVPTTETTPRDPKAMARGSWAGGEAVAAHAGGDRAAALATVARARGADMVVLPVHACGSLSQREPDGAPARILREARIPLLLVGPAAGRPATRPTPAAGA